MTPAEFALVLSAVNEARLKAQSQFTCGQGIQLPDGRAAGVEGLNVPGIGQDITGLTMGRVRLQLTSGITILDGGKVYFSYANRKANYCRALNSRDFYVGRAVGDADTVNGTVDVQLNIDPRFDLDAALDPWASVLVGTQAVGGFGYPYRRGGAQGLVLAATNEAEKVDILGIDSFVAGGGNAIIEAAVTVNNGDAGTAAIFNIGIASGTHATAVTSIAQYLTLKIGGNSTTIYLQSSDGTNSQAAISTTLTYTTSTRFEVWFDLRNPAAVAIYINGVQALSATTFNISAAASAWKLLAHLVKTATTDTADFQVDWFRARLAQQRG
jgi:hypothetical protein